MNFISSLYKKTLNVHTVPSGNSEFCFPSSLNVSFDFVSGNIESLGKIKLTINSLACRHYKCIISSPGAKIVGKVEYHNSSESSLPAKITKYRSFNFTQNVCQKFDMHLYKH